MSSRKEVEKVSLDDLITTGLHARVAEAEPSRDVWVRIENQLKHTKKNPPRTQPPEHEPQPQYARA